MGRSETVEEKALLERFSRGEVTALLDLFDRYEPLLRDRVRRILPAHLARRVSPSDVLQESRIVVLERHADFEAREAGAFRRWILGIVEKKARRAIQWHEGVGMRSAAREVPPGQRMETAAFAGSGPSPSQVAIGSELATLARKAIASLPEAYREVLRLSQEEHLTLREVADRTGRSYEAVKKLYGRGLARFGEKLRELRGESGG